LVEITAGRVGKGTYVLVARLGEMTEITVGQLGTFAFPAGWYAYAGSALGPGGVQARLDRHRRSQKRLHWHVDYLLAHSTLEGSWQIASAARLECTWAAAMCRLPGARLAVPRFGASDCRCPGHLIYFPCLPSEGQIADVLRRASPGNHIIEHDIYPSPIGR
jgi:Uri superfamily endonuclease